LAGAESEAPSADEDACHTDEDRSSDAGAPADEEDRDGTWDRASLTGFLGTANPRFVRALVAVAGSPERKLSTQAITEAAGLTAGRSWGGFLSRARISISARHRWGRNPPLKWDQWDAVHGQYIYTIDPDDARIIVDWANERARGFGSSTP
jgi:hypothetical protein